MHVAYKIALIAGGAFVAFALVVAILTYGIYRNADNVKDNGKDGDDKIIQAAMQEAIKEVAKNNSSPEDSDKEYDEFFPKD